MLLWWPTLSILFSPAYSYGDEVKYKCMPGFGFARFQPVKIITCTEYGHWSEKQLECRGEIYPKLSMGYCFTPKVALVIMGLQRGIWST